MNALIVEFTGMTLFLSGPHRSEALIANTNGSSHKHRHQIDINGSGAKDTVEEAVLWIEESGRILIDPLTDAADHLARMRDFTPRSVLHPTLTMEDPLKSPDWRMRVGVWFRLPGGELNTGEIGTTGEKVLWTIPPFDGEPEKKRQLTQFAKVTRGDVTGDVRLAIFSPRAGETRYISVPPNKTQDYKISFFTEYAGAAHSEPAPGDRVTLSEMQLMYDCLDSGRGPIPFVQSWPKGANLQKTFVTDPATGICPVGIITV
jgi:hypothetical protein